MDAFVSDQSATSYSHVVAIHRNVVFSDVDHFYSAAMGFEHLRSFDVSQP